MKNNTARLLLIMLAAFLLVAAAACENAEEVYADVYMKAVEAMKEINSYSFDIVTEQTMSMPGMPAESMVMNASGKAIEDPFAMQMDAQMIEQNMTLDMAVYMTGEEVYFYFDELGWIWMEISHPAARDIEVALQMADQGPEQALLMLKELDPSMLRFAEEGEYYMLELEDESGNLLNTMIAQMTDFIDPDLMSEEELEMIMESLSYSDISYFIKLDKKTFLPSQNIVSFKMEIDFMGEVLTMDTKMDMTYYDYGTVDSIVIPDEARENAVHVDQL